MFGVYSAPLARTVADALAVLESRRAFVVHGANGIDELSPAGPNLVLEVVEGAVRERVLDPAELGIAPSDPAELAGGTPDENARTTREILSGADGAQRDAVVLNAAGAIAAAGHAVDLREGLDLAREAIDSGARGGASGGARRVLARIRVMGRFAAALRQPGLTAIAEVKRRSPSAGDLRPDADPAALAAAYERAGAAAVSILVDERFGGTWDDLRAARASAALPLLAKGFFSTGADLRPRATRAPTQCCSSYVTSTSRRRDGCSTPPRSSGSRPSSRPTTPRNSSVRSRWTHRSSGINARDLTTFEIDRAEQLRLVARSPRDRVVVAESGIASRAQGAAAELAGADAILVGSTLMRAADPAAKLAELVSRPLVKVCGLTREEDVAAAAEVGADLVGFVFVEQSPRRVPDDFVVSDTVSDTFLTVAVTVGEADARGADLVQRYPVEAGKVRGRDAVLLRRR